MTASEAEEAGMTDAKAEPEEFGNLRPYTVDMWPRPTKGWDAAMYRSEDVIAAAEAVDVFRDELATVVDAQGEHQTMPIAAFKAMGNGVRSFAAAGMATPPEPMTPEMWDMRGSDALWALTTEWGQDMPPAPQDRSRRREAQRSHWEQIREDAQMAADPSPTEGWDETIWAAKLEAAKDAPEAAHTVARVAKEARAKARTASAGQGQRNHRPAHGQRPKGR